MSQLSKSELERYDRHLLIPEVGAEGQAKLKAAKVLVVGAGGLGAPVIQYLAAAGVGKLGIIDFDVVDLSNLQRQVIFATEDLGKSKAAVAAKKASSLNPEIEVIAYQEKLTAQNVNKIFWGYDIIVDGSDNFPTRYLINDACVSRGKSNIHGAVFRFEGQVTTFVPKAGPCYRCIFGEAPDSIQNCAQAGVLGILPGIIGTLQATETLKLILGEGALLSGELLLVDALDMSFRKIKVSRNSHCTACGDSPRLGSFAHLVDDNVVPTPNTPGKKILQDMYAQASKQAETSILVEPIELASELKQSRELIIIDVREPQEYEHSHIENAQHIPLGVLSDKLSELSTDANVVVYCRSGGRGLKAANILRAAGIKTARNLSGGLTAWSNEVDSSISVFR